MLHSLGAAALPSQVSPAALDKSFSARSLGRHCVEDILDKNGPRSSPVALLHQNLLSARGFLDVEPLGSAGSEHLSSSRPVIQPQQGISTPLRKEGQNGLAR